MAPTEERPSSTAPDDRSRSAGRLVTVLGAVVAVAGLVMLVSGAVTWATVQGSLADERIRVSDDADRFAGDKVDGPLTAYEEAETIEKHALEASDGRTYAELDRDDPRRDRVMTASFLRASLFTSVVAFGVAAMAMGLGAVLVLVGWGLVAVGRALAAPVADVAG